MKQIYQTLIFLIIAGFISNNTNAQQKHFIRIDENNDFLNISGHGTDKAYSNGTRIDYFYTRKNNNRSNLLLRLLPRAGSGSEQLYSIGLMQVMVTPNNISSTSFQNGDYAYAGGLFAIYSQRSFNRKKQITLQTDLMLGMRGPASFAAETQKAIHKLINYQVPMGWDMQLKEKVLANIEFTAEKGVLKAGNWLQLNIAGRLSAGTMIDMASLSPTIRIGRLPASDLPLVADRNSTGKQKIFYYLQVTGRQNLQLYNALLEGEPSILSSRAKENNTVSYQTPQLNHALSELILGAGIGNSKLSLHYFQTYSTPYSKGLYNHSVGNLVLYFSL